MQCKWENSIISRQVYMIRFFETPLSYDCVSNLELFYVWGTSVDGQFGWGGTGLKWYQARPKVISGGTEIHRRV